MRWISQLQMRAQMLFGRGRASRHLDDELQFHIDRQIAENRAAGMTADEARYAALRTFGNRALLREQTRSTWSWRWAESLVRDFRYGFRALRRTPGFALSAVFVVALGIGANIALFTVFRSVLLKPLAFKEPDQLVTLFEGDSRHRGFHNYLPVDAGSFFQWQSATAGRAEMALVSPWQDYNVSADSGKLPEKVKAAWCSANFFSILGVTPHLGRGFTDEDDRPNAQATVILTNAFWMRRYGGDPAIIGKTIWLDAKPFTVIGVLPQSFVFSTSFGGNKLQLWTPVRHEAPPFLLTTFSDHEFLVIARLLHGESLPMLVDQLGALQKRIQLSHAEGSVHDGAQGRSMLDDAVASYRTPLNALLAATCCVLLIACMNVAGLLVARSAARSKELAIRSALGGGKFRLLRERLVESLMLSAGGGGLGMFLAWAALQWLVHARADMNRIEAIHIDAVVAAFTVAIVGFCALSSGLIVALSAGGKNVLSALHDSSRAHSAGTGRVALRRFLLVSEVGLTVVLLVGANLLLKSYQRLRSSDMGVPIENVLTLQVDLPTARYKQPVQQVAFFENLIAQVRAIPGVQAAGLVSTPPGEGWNGDQLMSVVEHPPLQQRDWPDIHIRGADPGYFDAIHLPLLSGRVFTSGERLERANVVLISQLAAKALFQDENPIGKHLRSQNGDTSYEVVGVVGDTRWDAAQPALPTLYWPIYGNNYSFATIVVRASSHAEALALPVQKVVASLDPDLPVYGVMTLREAIGNSIVDSQFDSMLVLGFAVIALLLAAAGLYGVLAYLVTQRTTEIGIRMALGAQRGQVLRLVLADGLRPALYGLVLGLVGSIAAVRFIRSMLYETKPLDPAVFANVVAILLVTAAFACILPAWRASRLDPIQALRTD
ncbi:MAG TPA: ABC transporter permease [Terracidiphilus sp.]|jgi:predicted permease|nr:ABC transporter permease [Terracidiphilus sp.]